MRQGVTFANCDAMNAHALQAAVFGIPSFCTVRGLSPARVKAALSAATLWPSPQHVCVRDRQNLPRGSSARRTHFSGVVLASEGGAAAATVGDPEATVAATGPAPVPEDPKVVEGLDIRVGRILKAWKHPEADSLYVEEVDVGEESGPRTICSGLVKYVPEEELQGRAVLVLANLKPRNMRGVKSNGMLLAASDAAHETVELLLPPEGSQPGERVWFGGEEDGESQSAALAPNQVQKKKVWESIQPHLNTSEEGVARFLERPMRVSGGVVKSKSLKGANVS